MRGEIERIQPEYQELLKTYLSAVRGKLGDRLVSLCVFGSVATGTATPESDIDVLLVAEGLPEDMGFRIRELNPIHQELRKTPAWAKLRSMGRCALISEVILAPAEVEEHPPILLDLVDEGVILHDKEGFLKRVLASVKRRLEELGARKVKAKRGHYWILKPDLKPGEEVEI